MAKTRRLKYTKFMVPTYNAMLCPDKPEYGPAVTPVVVQHDNGLRIILGADSPDDMDKPDIQVERQPNGWMIFLHPNPGCDAAGYVYLHDDGRSFVLPETGAGPTEVIKVLGSHDEVPGFTVQENKPAGDQDRTESANDPTTILRIEDPADAPQKGKRCKPLPHSRSFEKDNKGAQLSKADTIKVGDYVRTYDFPDLPGMKTTCYVEGVVEAIGKVSGADACDRYTIKIERRVWQREEDAAWKEGKEFPTGRCYPPVNGLANWTGGVTKGVKVVPKLKGNK